MGISAASVSPQDVPKSNLLSPKVNVFQLTLLLVLKFDSCRKNVITSRLSDAKLVP